MSEEVAMRLFTLVPLVVVALVVAAGMVMALAAAFAPRRGRRRAHLRLAQRALVGVCLAAAALPACSNTNIDFGGFWLPSPPSPSPSPSASPSPGASGKRVSESVVDFFPFGANCPPGVAAPPNRQVPYPLNRACAPELTLTPFYDDRTKASPADTGAGDQEDVDVYRIALADITFDVEEGSARVELLRQPNRYNLVVRPLPAGPAGDVRVRATLRLPPHQGNRLVVAEWRAVLS